MGNKIRLTDYCIEQGLVFTGPCFFLSWTSSSVHTGASSVRISLVAARNHLSHNAR